MLSASDSILNLDLSIEIVIEIMRRIVSLGANSEDETQERLELIDRRLGS